MEVTTLCIRLLMNLLFLLCALDRKVDSASLRVEPNKLQFFRYDSVTLHCEGLNGSTGWKFHHQFKGELTKSVTIQTTSAGLSCTIKNVYVEDSGEYWCEAAGGKRSNSIDIAVTNGSVILESPVHPEEGDVVTLRCREKTTSSKPGHFYKDGRLIESRSTGIMTIDRVSMSDEGIYKCSISGAGESPQSRLTVRAPIEPQHPETDQAFFILRIICPLVLMAMLFVLLGLLHCGNLGGSRSQRAVCCDCGKTRRVSQVR